MDNIYSLQGQAAEETVMWILREAQAGRFVDTEQAYTRIAQPFLRRKWQESQEQLWKANAKRYCCLREHYYGIWDKETAHERTKTMADYTRTCITNFIERILSRLKDIKPEDEVLIAGPGQGGDPESFEMEGIKIYAIPDYVHREGTVMHIHDWKAGKVKASHQEQLALYGLWAHVKKGVAVDDVCCYVEYLATGQMAPVVFSQESMEQIIERISESVADMRGYLVDENLDTNKSLPKTEWELTADPRLCRMCNFYELCRPELERG
jgi:CRISPR/Cas system-associated exonuclease Cas4 (RecB family)